MPIALVSYPGRYPALVAKQGSTALVAASRPRSRWHATRPQL